MANKILIVEDEPKLAQLLVDYLKQSGFDTEVIADGLEAFTWLQENHSSVDLMILDLMLEVISSKRLH